MKEPFLTQFRDLIRKGASNQDIHDADNIKNIISSERIESNEYIDREVSRVGAHQSTLLPILEHFVIHARRILDVGCSSGGTAVALALSDRLRSTEIIGIDPNITAIEAARIRAQGYGIESDRLKFEINTPNQPLPFQDDTFDLITCVSVLEFVTDPSLRKLLVSEIQRVVKPGGYIFIATPNSYRLREHHTGRFFGNFSRLDGNPWPSSPRSIRRMLHSCNQISITEFAVHHTLKRNAPVIASLPFISYIAQIFLPWQKHLFQKKTP
jgi:2-polyprenyl-3-methyl-5-hydroxy-6-metoxy-1,4-benzoquinol methylase